MALKKKVALVIGGTGIIGRTICQKLAREKAEVVIAFHSDEIKAMETLKLVEEFSSGSLYQCDVCNWDSITQLIDFFNDAYGKIDIFVYATGGPLLPENGLPENNELLKKNIDLSYTGFYNCIQQVLPLMRRQNYGRIIALGSAGADSIQASAWIAWQSAKTALTKLVKSTSVVEITNGITMNLVNPSVVLPDIYFSAEEEQLIEMAFPEAVREKIRLIIPAKRFAKAEEVADAVVFFADEKSGYITGNVLNVSGGMGI